MKLTPGPRSIIMMGLFNNSPWFKVLAVFVIGAVACLLLQNLAAGQQKSLLKGEIN